MRQWKSIDFKYLYWGWFPLVGPMLEWWNRIQGFWECNSLFELFDVLSALSLSIPVFPSLQLTALSTLWVWYCRCRSLLSASSQSGQASTWLLPVSPTFPTSGVADPAFLYRVSAWKPLRQPGVVDLISITWSPGIHWFLIYRLHRLLFKQQTLKRLLCTVAAVL